MAGPHGPGPRGPAPKISNPGKLLSRLMKFVFSRYAIHYVVVVVCILLSVFCSVQGTLFMQTLIDDYIQPMIGVANPDYGPLLGAMSRVAFFYAIGVFAAFLQQGDVLATVSGHDHTNNFVINHRGIDIINTPGVGFSSYNDETVGSRVFVIDENDPANYETYMEGYFDVYGDDEEALYRYQAYSRTTDDLTKVVAWFKMVFIVISNLF